MDTPVSAATIKKLKTFFQIANDLKAGKHFNITRLTSLKRFCEDPAAAARFALCLSKLTQKAVKEADCPKYTDERDWKRYRQHINKAVRLMNGQIKQSGADGHKMLRDQYSTVKAEQDEYENQRWVLVRIIESRELLLVETALSIFLNRSPTSTLGYDLARQYAERYSPHHGNGLIPESAKYVQDIAEFWAKHFLGRNWRKQIQPTDDLDR